MALVSVYSVKVQDVNGKVGHTVIYLPSGLTVAQIQAWSDAMLAKYNEVTAAKIIAANVQLALTLPAGLKTDPMAGQYIPLGANVAFNVANSAYRHTLRVPAIREALISGDSVVLTGTDPAAWVVLLATGDGTVAPASEEGNDLGTLIGATASFRKG